MDMLQIESSLVFMTRGYLLLLQKKLASSSPAENVHSFLCLFLQAFGRPWVQTLRTLG